MFPKSRFQSIPLSVHGIFLGKVSHTGLPFLCCRDLAAAQKEITALKQKVNDAFAEIKKLAKGQDVALADVEVRKRFPFIPCPVGTVFSFMISVHFHFHFHFYFHFPFLCFSRLVFPSLVQAQPLPFCHFHFATFICCSLCLGYCTGTISSFSFCFLLYKSWTSVIGAGTWPMRRKRC